MAIFPIVEEVNIQEDIIQDRGINFLYDFNIGDLVSKDGKFIKLTGDAAVAFWVEKTLRTEHERAMVYKNTGYGAKLEGLRGTVLPREIAKNIFESNIKDALLTHERIKSVDNFIFSQEYEQIVISFEIKLNALNEETESTYSGSEEGFTKLSTLEEIKGFLGIKLINSDTYSTTINL